jgi:hypothetical protein
MFFVNGAVLLELPCHLFLLHKDYCLFSSILCSGSYFYDKKTDAVYDVDWGEMDDFMAGKLKPIFTSFYAFLEWYYSEEG